MKHCSSSSTYMSIHACLGVRSEQNGAVVDGLGGKVKRRSEEGTRQPHNYALRDRKRANIPLAASVEESCRRSQEQGCVSYIRSKHFQYAHGVSTLRSFRMMPHYRRCGAVGTDFQGRLRLSFIIKYQKERHTRRERVGGPGVYYSTVSPSVLLSNWISLPVTLA